MFLKVRFILYCNYSGKRTGANLAGTRSPLHSALENPPELLSASTVWGIYMDILSMYIYINIYSGIPWSCHGVMFFSYCVATCAKRYAPRACSWSGLRRIRCTTHKTFTIQSNVSQTPQGCLGPGRVGFLGLHWLALAELVALVSLVALISLATLVA